MLDSHGNQFQLSPVLYDVFQGRASSGGKRVAVFADMAGDLQMRAAQAGAPLSVFVELQGERRLRLRVFTPTKEKGDSDSASIAACQWYQDQGHETDTLELISGRLDAAGPIVNAQLCGEDWLLEQGHVQVQACPVPAFAGAKAAYLAQTERPNLMLEVADLAALDAFVPGAETIIELNRQTETTGLVLYTLDRPSDGPQRRADVSFRAFGPLKGFLEDAASSNMFACLTGVLIHRQQIPEGELMIRGAQRKPGAPSLLGAQFGAADDLIWVGGTAVQGKASC